MEQKLLREVEKIFIAHLKNRQLRKTPERCAILEEIYSKKGHFDVESLYINMKLKNYRVSRATVYNTLDILVECNLVTKHQFGKNQSQYEKAYGFKQHDQLVCIDCDKLLEFCDPRIQNIQTTVEKTLQHKILHHSLVFYANCQNNDCENKKTT